MCGVVISESALLLSNVGLGAPCVFLPSLTGAFKVFETTVFGGDKERALEAQRERNNKFGFFSFFPLLSLRPPAETLAELRPLMKQ